MQTLLPQGKLAPTRVNPKISVFYGMPKIGKTTMAAELPGHLILDMEKGAEAISATRIYVPSITGKTVMEPDPENPGQERLAAMPLQNFINEMMRIGLEYFKEHNKRMKPLYKFLVVDTVDKLEDYCIKTATEKYKASTIGKKFDGESVLELPQGGGYYHLRNEVLYWIDQLAMMTDHLILISHIREKNLDKGGITVETRDLALTGKLGQIVCAKADIIGYMYQQKIGQENKLMVSFETYDNATMGARFPRLAGQKFELDWNRIFLPDETPVAAPAQ